MEIRVHDIVIWRDCQMMVQEVYDHTLIVKSIELDSAKSFNGALIGIKKEEVQGILLTI